MGIVYIAKYILREEYQCGCCAGLPPSYTEPHDIAFETLFDSFALIRERWGRPLNISSGYRCPGWNSYVSGHPLSQHQFGLALDLDVESEQVETLHNIIEEVAPDLRVGKYPGFIHIDAGYFVYPKASHSWQKGYRWREI